MKRTEYNEHMRNIKCSENFKAKMERMLSDAPQEMHEYEDSVQGVERAKRFNVSRFATLAAALVIVGGGVGMGLKGMKNMRITNPMYGTEQSVSGFPYSELKELHNAQQIHGGINWENHNEEIMEQLVQTFDSRTGDMSNMQLDTLFEFFDMDEWYSVDHKDMSETNGKSKLEITLSTDGDKSSYIFRIFDDGQAYFTKNGDSSSEYCYKFDENTFIRYRELLRMNDNDELYSSVKNKNIHYLFLGNIENYNTERKGFTADISDATNNSMKDMLLDIVKFNSYSEIEFSEVESKLNGKFVCIGYDDTDGSEFNSIIITDRGELIFCNNNEDVKSFVYDVGTDFYEKMKKLAENNEGTGSHDYEIVQQEIINEIIDKYIREETMICVNSQLLIDGMYQNYISQCVDVENIEEVKDKMKSIQWEKCDNMLAHTDEYKDSVRQYLWETVFFNDKGLLYNDAEFCYRPVNAEDVEELVEMLYSNVKTLSPEMRLMMSLSEGFNFSNVKGSYSAIHEVPTEVSETGESYYVQSKGTIYADKSIYGIIAEGEGYELESNEPRRYCYISYADDDRVCYDEARGEGVSTAHYDGRRENMLHEFDYFGMYKKIVNLLDSHLEFDDWECLNEGYDIGVNDTVVRNYAFTWTEDNIEKTMNVFVDEQGKLIKYNLTDKDGKVTEQFELHDDCVFDSDDFEIPEMY